MVNREHFFHTLIYGSQQSSYAIDNISENSITNSTILTRRKYTKHNTFPALCLSVAFLSLSLALALNTKIKSKNNYYLNFPINNYIIRLWFCLQQHLFAHYLLLCALC